MKLTKKIVSLAAVLALSCTFAVSAATFDSTTATVTEATNGYTVDVPVATVETGDQYTVLVYKISDENIMEEIATATIPVPSNTNITYINQDDFTTIAAEDAYTIAFALGANVNGDGTYKVLVGGTNVATAAVGYFKIGEDAPTYTLGDVDGNGVINATDAGWVLSKYADSSLVLPCGVDAAADVDGNGTINATDAGWVLSKYADSSLVFPAEQ